MKKSKGRAIIIFSVIIPLIVSLGCTEPLTKREQSGLVGAGIGTVGGAIIGSTAGRAAAGALIGGPIGLLAGALVGDQLMGQEKRQDIQERELRENRAEIARLRREVERLRRELGER
jgi:outer membrane lipoprotein SlyB